MIPYGCHFVDEDDVAAVVDVLRNHHLTQGKFVLKFEKLMAEYVGAKYAVAVSSWTSGLHLACITAGLKLGQVLITSPNTFVASSNAGLYVGARPAFADIDPTTLNMSPAKLEEVLKNNPQTKVVIPVHFAGLPCDMEAISQICKKYDVTIIEDAAHALGGTYRNGKRVGCCCHSLMTGFSFHPVKAIATGEGGLITTNDENIYRDLLRLRSHGINKGNDRLVNLEEAYTDGQMNQWYYEMFELGHNYRITDIQCALGISQCNKLDRFVKRRREIANHYDSQLKTCENLMVTQLGRRNESGNHLYVLRVNYEKIGKTRYQLLDELEKMGIQGHVHYIPVPMHPHYKQFNIPVESYAECLHYYRQALTIPLFATMTDEQVETVVRAIKKLIG